MTKEQLRLVAQWKAPRSAGHIEKNDETYVREITSLAFSAKEERTRTEAGRHHQQTVMSFLQGGCEQWDSRCKSTWCGCRCCDEGTPARRFLVIYKK